jgi:hypothetical protein
MSRVFTSQRTSAAVYVFADDHCPPHIHARHRGEGWVARIGFSYVTNKVRLISIMPLRNTPLQRVVGQLLDDVWAELAACRRAWWMTRSTTCLANRWARTSGGELEILAKPEAGALQVRNADYMPDTEQLHIVFADGAVVQIAAGTGVEHDPS